MKFKGAAIATVVSMALTGLAASVATAQQLATGGYELAINTAELTTSSEATSKKSTGVFIVQLKGDAGVSHQLSLEGRSGGAATTLRNAGNTYNAKSPSMQAYLAKMKAEQAAVISSADDIVVLHNYYHTFNGFAAKLSAKQLVAIRANPNVVGVWEDEKLQLTTSNTPAFLGLTGPNGQHTNGVKGEGVVVGIVDSGIWPENPSFADDGTYAAPSSEDWNGACNVGTAGAANDASGLVDPMGFECNNKLIGARYFGAGFAAVYDIQFGFGEFNSARDADGHGSHTAGTAAGNLVENAIYQGANVGTLSGIAPRAYVAAYKVCWNSDYVSPAGANERGCFGSDSQAAIDAAVADGVDVINYSISGSQTSVVAPQTVAMLRAADAGVFVSVSAGNSGPATGVVGTPAPWVMSVGASTYDGNRAVVADEIAVTVGGESAPSVAAIPGGFSPVWETGFSGSVQVAQDFLACTPVPEGGQNFAGDVALVSRGACPFVTKVANMKAAGASAVIVVQNTVGGPTVMGGTANETNNIPSAMIGLEQGTALRNAAVELPTSVTYTGGKVSFTVAEVGNVMAQFSSRGQNEAVADIIKPDITAPGVNVLASTSAMQLDYPGNNPLQGQDYAYLSGTSMSSPHIAGMAALLTEQFPSWTPAQKKSALMTTAYQNVRDWNGAVPTPFVFGSGHANVLAARNPGFTYGADWRDYSGYLCGRGQDAVVGAFTGGIPCSAFAGAGFSPDATQLNYPSIAVAQLIQSEVVVREVTDVTGVSQSYDISLNLPAGITGFVLVSDGAGGFVPSTTLAVPGGGSALYGLVLEVGASATLEQWAFGSVTFTSGDIVNRSPIALRPLPPPVIAVPERVTLELDRRGRASFPVEFAYSGTTSMESKGLSTPFGSAGNVSQDADQTFAFNEPGLGIHFIEVPAGSTLARFTLFEDFVAVPGADIDLIVYRCIDFSCGTVTDSLNAGSNENIELLNPAPASGNNGRDFYLIWAHGFDLGLGQEVPPTSTDYTLVYWIVDAKERNSSITMSSRAVEGKFNNVTVSGRNLPFFSYMGTAEFFDGEGQSQGTTIIEVLP